MSRFFRSFRFAFAGIRFVARTQPNMRLHLLAAVAVAIAGFVLKVSAVEWGLLSLCIGLVIALECVNTSLEQLANRVTTETDPLIKQAKDCAAAAVLAITVASVIVGGIIFVPRLLTLFQSSRI